MWWVYPAAENAVDQNVSQILGAKGSPTCTNYALKRNGTDKETTFPEAVVILKNKFYRDNYRKGSNTERTKSRKKASQKQIHSHKGCQKSPLLVVNSQSNGETYQW